MFFRIWRQNSSPGSFAFSRLGNWAEINQGEISIDKRAHMERPLYSSRLHGNIYSGTPLYRHPFITDSFGCPDEKVIFSLKSTLLIPKR